MTNAKVVKPAGLGHEISAREAWKLFGIMAEFFEATEPVAGIRLAVLEAMTLVQTGKGRQMPAILAHF